MTLEERIQGCFVGLAVGDALGVPVEFTDRESLSAQPVVDMRGFGTWNQPAGTWSDDSSLAFCTAEALCDGYYIDAIAKNFVKWSYEGYWGAHHKVFDIGNATKVAIERLRSGVSPLKSGNIEESSNGNGSLMRIAPASIYFHKQNNSDIHRRIIEISGITHAHRISIQTCYAFSLIIKNIIEGKDKDLACDDSGRYYKNQPVEEVKSSGFVLDTFQASIWCFLNSSSYKEAVLKAVNLGDDTDTTACVTGALAGLYYGVDAIPSEWSTAIARYSDITDLAARFHSKVKQG